MPFKMKHITGRTEISPVMRKTMLEVHEKYLLDAVKRGAGHNVNTVLIEGKGPETRGMRELVENAAKKGTGKVKVVTGVGTLDIANKPSPIVLLHSKANGRIDISGDMSSVSFLIRSKEAREAGYIPREMEGRDMSMADDAEFTRHTMVALQVQGAENPHRTSFVIDLHSKKERDGNVPVEQKTFFDIESQLANFISSDDSFNVGVAVLFGSFSDIILKTTMEAEFFGPNAPKKADPGELFKPSGIGPVPAVITLGVNYNQQSTKEITVVNSVIVMEHDGKLYGGNIKGAKSVDPFNYGVLFVDKK